MIRKCEVSDGFVDPSMAAEFGIVGVQDDAVFTVTRDRDSVIRYGITGMKIKDEDEVVSLKYDRLIRLIHI
jgi:hypothetical protein